MVVDVCYLFVFRGVFFFAYCFRRSRFSHVFDVNIGIILTNFGDYEKAEEHWKDALKINESIGNLEQEGILLNNFGEFYFYRKKYDLAVDSYLKAQNIFLSLGNEIKYGLTLKSLGEVYLKICEYQKSLNTLRGRSEL